MIRNPGGKHVAWILLIVAGLLEVGWAIGLKYTEGFSRLWPSVLTLAAMGASVLLLGIAMKSLPVGTSYAVWVGVGAVGTAILGMVLLGEPANAGRLVSLGFIVAGIVGLKLATPPRALPRGSPTSISSASCLPACFGAPSRSSHHVSFR